MASSSLIEWTEMTWNPVTGCTKISQGCKRCYAERMARRLKAMNNPRCQRGFRVTLHPDLIDAPKRWRTPKVVFVNSMSDLFHEKIPFDFIRQVFDSMVVCPQHTYQVLTKRSGCLREIAPTLPWPANVWMGVSVENNRVISRVDDLRHVPASVRFLSCEPLIGPLDNLDLDGVGWVIVGGESGPLEPAPWKRRGFVEYTPSVGTVMCSWSSSNGGVIANTLMAGFWIAGRLTRCQR